MTKAMVHKVYQEAADTQGYISVSYSKFTQLWSHVCPHISVMKPSSDLGPLCQKNMTNLSHASNLTEEENSAKLEEFQQHLPSCQAAATGQQGLVCRLRSHLPGPAHRSTAVWAACQQPGHDSAPEPWLPATGALPHWCPASKSSVLPHTAQVLSVHCVQSVERQISFLLEWWGRELWQGCQCNLQLVPSLYCGPWSGKEELAVAFWQLCWTELKQQYDAVHGMALHDWAAHYHPRVCHAGWSHQILVWPSRWHI